MSQVAKYVAFEFVLACYLAGIVNSLPLLRNLAGKGGAFV